MRGKKWMRCFINHSAYAKRDIGTKSYPPLYLVRSLKRFADRTNASKLERKKKKERYIGGQKLQLFGALTYMAFLKEQPTAIPVSLLRILICTLLWIRNSYSQHKGAIVVSDVRTGIQMHITSFSWKINVCQWFPQRIRIVVFVRKWISYILCILCDNATDVSLLLLLILLLINVDKNKLMIIHPSLMRYI